MTEKNIPDFWAWIIVMVMLSLVYGIAGFEIAILVTLFIFLWYWMVVLGDDNKEKEENKK